MNEKQLNEFFENNTDLKLRLEYIITHAPKPIIYSTSFGLECQYITHHIAQDFRDDIALITLDTGRLFEETYQVWQATCDKYNLKIQAFYPNPQQIQDYVLQNGINGFKNSVPQRQKCCEIRKVYPLKLALSGVKTWISGLRNQSSLARKYCNYASFEDNIWKINPIIDYSREEIWQFAQDSNIPINQLHFQSYPSIGCAPCTSPVAIGESERAGRWRWEQDSAKECGIHQSKGQ